MDQIEIPQIKTNTIHLWYIPLNTKVIREQEINFLSIDEIEKANSFHFAKHRQAYIRRRNAIRQILGLYCNIEPNLLQFNYTKYQKPYLTYNPNNFQFNIADSHNLAVLAITTQTLIGVDLEYLKPMQDLTGIAEQFFSTEEYNKFIALPTAEQLTAFYTIWTRKEAFVKAIGEGLSYPLSTFSVAFLPTEPSQLLSINNSPSNTNNWILSEFSINYLNELYIGAIATHSPKKEIISFFFNSPFNLNSRNL